MLNCSCIRILFFSVSFNHPISFLGDRNSQRLQSVDEGLSHQRHALGHRIGPNQAFRAGYHWRLIVIGLIFQW